MEEAPFIISIVAMTMGTFLVTMKMIIGHLRWRVQQRQKNTGDLEGSVRLVELEELMRQAALEANEPLMRRIERLDRQMHLLSETSSPGAAQPESDEEAPPKSLGRLSTGGKG